MRYMQKAEFRSASITRKEYVWYVEFIKVNGIKSIMEFGPGVTTYALLESADTIVRSYEHNDKWLSWARELFDHEPRVDVRKYPDVDYAGPYDMINVDAPPGKGHHSRMDTCLIASELSDLFILHDARRDGEKSTIEVFVDKGWGFEYLPTERGIAILSKRLYTKVDPDAVFDTYKLQ